MLTRNAFSHLPKETRLQTEQDQDQTALLEELPDHGLLCLLIEI